MKITAREIVDSDLEMIMNWRMSLDVTRYMNTNPKLTMEGQKKWKDSQEKNDRAMDWVVECDSKPVGIINLAKIDWEKKTTSWGYYIGEKKARSFELAISLEMSLYDFVFDELGLSELYAETFSLNKGVIKLHTLCGSHITEVVEGEVIKEGVAYDVTHTVITKDEWNEIKSERKYEKVKFEVGEKLCTHLRN